MDRRLAAVLSGSGPQRLFKYFGGSDPRLSGGTYSGASVKTYVDSAGVVQYAPMNKVRQSDTLATTWTVGGNAVPTNGVGTYAGVNFSRLSTATSWGANYVTIGVTLVGDGVRGFSLYAKQDGSNAGTFPFTLKDETAGQNRVLGTLTVAADGSISCAATTGTLLGTDSVGTGVYRFRFQSTSATAANTHSVYLGGGAGGTVLSILLGGIQAEDNPIPTTYTPTTTTAVYAPRYAHYVNGQGPCLLLEGSRTNALTYSNDTSNAVWSTKNQVTNTLNAVGPDGTANGASTIAESAVAGQAHYFLRTDITMTANATQAFSVFVKANGRTQGRFYHYNGADVTGVVFNLTTVAATAYTAGSGTSASVGIIALGTTGWYRVWFTGKANASSTTGNLSFILRDAGGNETYNGDGTSGVIVWGFQHEKDASFISSVVPTTSAAVTRAADSLSFAFAATPQAMTVYADCYDLGQDQTSSARLWHIGKSDATTPYFINYIAGGMYGCEHSTSGGTVNKFGGAAPSYGQRIENRDVLGSDGSVIHGQSIAAAAETVTAASAAQALQAAWSDTVIYVGCRGSFNTGFLALSSLKIAAGNQQLATMRAA